MKITAAISHQPNQPFSIEEVELKDTLLPNEVLVEIVATGICHTDMAMRDLPVDHVQMPKPSVLGHEGAGIVQRIGSAVTKLQPGDHVILSFHYDGSCPNCQKGLYPYCDDYFKFNLSGLRQDGSTTIESPVHGEIHGSMHHQSSFATYSLATENSAIKVPKDMPLEYLGPLGCGFLTGAGGVLNVLKPHAGSSFVMFGTGSLGCAALVMARLADCGTIIAVDLHDNRLELAKTIGATHTVNAGRENPVKAINAIVPGGVDYTFEATGVAEVMTHAIKVLGNGGHCLLGGYVPDPRKKAEITPLFFTQNRRVTGALMGHSDSSATILKLVDYVKDGVFPIKELVTFYDFADINQAIEDSEKGKTIKAIVRMPQ